MPTSTLTVALVGNPNAGKSTLFNALSGLRQHTGNYPGVTVEMKKSQCQIGKVILDLIDLPGTYSLAPRSPDEMVSVDLLLGRMKEEKQPDVIVSVVDASNLDRHLYLTTQLMSIGKPVILAINMIDVATSRGIKIDAAKLSESTGLPVVMLQANQGTGIEELKSTIINSIQTFPKIPGPALPQAFNLEADLLKLSLNGSVPPFLVERLLLDVNGHTEKWLVGQYGENLKLKLIAARTRLSEAGHAIPGAEVKARYQWVRKAVGGAVTLPKEPIANQTDRLDKILTHKIWGTLVFLAIMFVVFQLIFVAATPVMDGIKWLQSQLAEWTMSKLPVGPVRSLVGEGIIQGVGSVIVFLPQILILFGLIAILEDCGYMARAAFLMDKIMSKCGLNGKSFIPLLSSVACAVPGIMATRVIENRRDRFATILVAPLMSCSARLPIYSLLIGAFLTAGYPRWLPGLSLFGLYLIGFITAPLIALLLKRTLLRGATPVFVMELPAYKRPSLRNILRRMYDAGGAFLRRAGTLIFATMILIWAAMYFPSAMPDGTSYESAIEQAKERVEQAGEDADKKSAAESEIRKLKSDWKRDSYLGKVGRALEPAVSPLGWDWKIGTATLASFPAREVIVGTLGLIYEQEEDDEKKDTLGTAIQADWKNDPVRSKYGIPVALSVMVFFALCCQCASTLAVIRRETNSWHWPVFTFVYMTVLAYIGAFATFQIGKLLIG